MRFLCLLNRPRAARWPASLLLLTAGLPLAAACGSPAPTAPQPPPGDVRPADAPTPSTTPACYDCRPWMMADKEPIQLSG